VPSGGRLHQRPRCPRSGPKRRGFLAVICPARTWVETGVSTLRCKKLKSFQCGWADSLAPASSGAQARASRAMVSPSSMRNKIDEVHSIPNPIGRRVPSRANENQPVEYKQWYASRNATILVQASLGWRMGNGRPVGYRTNFCRRWALRIGYGAENSLFFANDGLFNP
jgi:hypothetical protein